MKNSKHHIFKTTVALGALLAVTAVAPALTFNGFAPFELVASAATDNTADMVANPQKYFSYISNSDGTVSITAYIGSSSETKIRIPGRINGKRVKEVGTGSFRNPLFNSEASNNVTSITVDEYVSVIKGFSFANCPNLTTINLPFTITTIETSAASNCPKLTKVSINNVLPTVRVGAFAYCPMLKNATSNIGAIALIKGGAEIETVCGKPLSYEVLYQIDNTQDMVDNPYLYFDYKTNSDGTVSITKFTGSKYNARIRIPGKINGQVVKEVGTGSYRDPFFSSENCQYVRSIVVDNNVSTINDFTFANCPVLLTLSLPSSVKTIKSSAVSNCPELTDVTLNSAAPEVGIAAFSGCPKLTNAFSAQDAVSLIFGGADIKTINYSNILTDNGYAKLPSLNSYVKNALYNDYDRFEHTTLMTKYLNRYAEYIVKNELNLTSSSSPNQKVSKIYSYVKNKVSYDNDAFYYEYDSNGNCIGVKQPDLTKSTSAGTIFFRDKAVCEGYAKGLNFLFKAAGIESYRVSTACMIKVYNNNTWETTPVGHAFNVVKLDNMYFVVDETGDTNLSFLVSAKKQMEYRSTYDVSKWDFFDQNGNEATIDLSKKLIYDLGDVNRDGYINNKDINLVSTAYTSGVKAVLDQCGLTEAEFMVLADVNCNGIIDSNDSYYVWGRYNSCKNAGLDVGEY
jgi:hypothetical protein